MSLLTVATTTLLGTVSLVATEAKTPNAPSLVQNTAPWMSTQHIPAPTHGIMVTKEGCTYRRVQAPGYPPRWILIVNASSTGAIGGRRARCKGML